MSKSIFDPEQIHAAAMDEQLMRERRELLQEIQQTRAAFENGCLSGFHRVWRRGAREDIQKFLNVFTLAEQQEIFTNHAAAMQFLSRFPGFQPQLPPYSFEWTEAGIAVGDPVTPA
jgi:hypothetical protein